MSIASNSRIRCLTTVFALIASLVTTSANAAPDPNGAIKIFEEAKTICERDAGVLWGQTLCGPIMLVDPTDRSIVANQVDGGGVLKASNSIFTGVLPPSELLANTTVEWSGTRWTQMLWPLPDEATKRHVLIAHEMFHRIQSDLGLKQSDGNNKHLDTLEGRYLLQLEWRALAKALNATTASGRTAAISDALLFRNERYRLFPQAASEEALLELNEGVAEYTGVRLGLTTQQARISFAIYDLTAFVKSPTFVRSFAYATGPAYGLMLDQADPEWRTKLKTGPRLDQLLSSALKLPASDFASLKQRQLAYDNGTLRTSELKRDEEKKARLAVLTTKFVEGAVLILPLQKSSYQFNPQTLQPLGESGTFYPTLRLTDNWGVLEVDGGALLDGKNKLAKVSAAGIDPSNLKGDGWRLTIKQGWVVQAGSRKGDLVVKQSEESVR